MRVQVQTRECHSREARLHVPLLHPMLVLSSLTGSSLAHSRRYADVLAISHVRFGSEADICAAISHVRFTPNSDRESRHPQPVMSTLPPKADIPPNVLQACGEHEQAPCS